MSGYTKLFGSILDSTVWDLPHATVRVWVTLLAMADRHGEVQAAVPGLAHRARVTLEETKAALSAFLSPDEYSRTPDQEGRRIEPIDGGWRLVNHEKYRRLMADEDRKAKAAERQHRYAEKRQQPSATVSNRQAASAGVSKRQNDAIAESEAESEAKAETSKNPDSLAPLGEPSYPAEFELVWSETGKVGTKAKAFKAWKKRGKPAWSVVEPAHRAYMLSADPVRGYVMHLSTWFNDGCHLQGWLPATAKSTQRDVSKGWAAPSGGPYPSGEQEI